MKLATFHQSKSPSQNIDLHYQCSQEGYLFQVLITLLVVREEICLPALPIRSLIPVSAESIISRVNKLSLISYRNLYTGSRDLNHLPNQ